MKIADVVKKLNLRVYAGSKGLNREVKGAYVCDLLSDVMGNSSEGDIWITMQGHKNVIAVSDLKEHSGILMVNGNTPDQETSRKSEDLGLPLLGTDDPAFIVAGRLFELMKEK